MNRGILSRGSILLVILMLVNMIGVSFAGTSSQGNVTAVIPDQNHGLFEVSVNVNGSWLDLGTYPANEWFKDYDLNIPSAYTSGAELSLKISKIGGGLAHLDGLELEEGQLSPDKLDAKTHRKLETVDHDVVEVSEAGLVFTFKNLTGIGDRNFKFNGRVEPQTLPQRAFTYPRNNDSRRIDSSAMFYVYEWDSHVKSNILDGDITDFSGLAPLFKVLDQPGSGHPTGYTYGWVTNDDAYLYAVIDFTSDNTYDGDKDYASLYIDTPSGVKQFTVSENEKTWGLPAFTYTDKVSYEHKVYEFKIPMSEFSDVDKSDMRLLFTAYGTSLPPEPVSSDVAYNSQLNEYLVVYEVSEGSDTGIMAMRYDYQGNALGSAVTVEAVSPDAPMEPRVTYNSVQNEYLIVYSKEGIYQSDPQASPISTVRIEGVIAQPSGVSGLSLGSPTYLDASQVAGSGDLINEYRYKVDVEYSKDNNSYAVVWIQGGEIGGSHIEGNIVNASLTPTATLNFGSSTGNAGDLDISYNSTDFTYTVVYQMTVTGGYEVFANEFDKYGSNIVKEIGISHQASDTSPMHGIPSVVHNINQEDEYIVWIDGNTNEVVGTYRNTTGSAITIGSPASIGQRTVTLAKGQTSTEIMAMWIHNEYTDGVTFSSIYGQLIDGAGSKVGSAITLYGDPQNPSQTMTQYLGAAGSGFGRYLYAHMEAPFAGSTNLLANDYGPYAYGDIDFEDISVNVDEGNDIALTVERHNGVDGQVSVDYTISLLSAQAEDITGSSGNLVLENGQEKATITIQTNQDAEAEPLETLTVTLSNPSGGATLKTDILATINIIDDDSGEIIIPPIDQPQASGNFDPDLAFSSSANQYLLVYEAFDLQNEQSALKGQFYSNTGSLVGSTFDVVGVSNKFPSHPELVYNSASAFYMLAWIEDQSGLATVHYKKLNPNGTESTSAQSVGNTGTQQHVDLSLAHNPSSDVYLLTWEAYDAELETETVKAGLIDSSGNLSPLSLNITEEAHEPVVTYNADTGLFVMAYVSVDQGVPSVKHMTLNGSGQVQGGPTAIQTSEYGQKSPVIASDQSSAVKDDYILWLEDSTPHKVLGKYRTVSGASIELASAEEEQSGRDSAQVEFVERRVFWIDKSQDTTPVYSLNTQYINDSGSLEGSEVQLDSATTPFVNISSAKDSGSGDFLVSYEYASASGSSIRVALLDVNVTSPAAITMGTSALSVQEGGQIMLSVMRTGNLNGTDTVNYSSAHGTADGSDYTSASGTISFAPGVSEAFIPLDTIADNIYEANETFTVTLTQASGNAVLGNTLQTIVTIVNDDPMPQFNMASPTISGQEGTNLTLLVTRTANVYGTDSVSYQVSNGSASNSDYTLAGETLTFSPQDTSKSIVIPLTQDSQVEGNETFTVSLVSASEGSGLGSDISSLVTIIDDDQADTGEDDTPASTNDSTQSQVSQQEAQDTASQKDVENLTSALTSASKSSTETLSVNVADAYLNVIERNIEEIEDEQVLTQTLTSYVETIEAIAVIGNQPQEQKWVEDRIIQMSSVVSDAIQKIEDDASIIKVASAVLEQVQTIKTPSQVEKSVEVKNQIGKLAQSVLTQVSKIKIKPTIEVKEGVSQVKFDQQSLADSITQKADNFNKLSSSFNAFYGQENVRRFDFEVTLVTEQVSDQVQVPIDPQTIQTLNNAGVDALSVAVGGTSITLDKDVFTGQGEEAGQELIVDMNFNSQGFEVRDENINFKSGYITDVRVFKGNAQKEKLGKPVDLSFDLSAFEFWDENPNPSSLSIFRLNENTGEWEPVGGVYDPVTNTVKTKRLTLSQYTVMQSNKSFSDVDNSWAKDEINELLGKGIIDETASFNPEETISREEFTTWVVRAYGVVDDEADAPFGDVDESHEHYTELASAFNAGIVSGNGDGSFNPGSAMTKEQMSAILANAMTQYDDKKLNEGLTGILASASDADLVSDWAGDDIAMLVELGVLDNSSGEINPQQELSKEEAASILKKIYG